jgi:eukaryotic-like serine/threonine-protein kinase
MQEQSIFSEALEKEDPAERAAFLERACAGDPSLRQRLDRLLQRHQQGDNFLEGLAGGVVGVVATVAEPVSERPGTVIGPYKLLQQIGEGGMGTVYMAEQTQPVQRKVALKVIKPGMDSRQVIARFEAERQALAMMDHVNIARVLDAGATEAGRPYFVMELVHGVPITKYCDDNQLTPRERLELFVPVCQAIQHAHQKGIIHRDIKPSNVMITLYDGKPVPKVIDFGVAKATEQKLTERMLFTQYGTMVGTLEATALVHEAYLRLVGQSEE